MHWNMFKLIKFIDVCLNYKLQIVVEFTRTSWRVSARGSFSRFGTPFPRTNLKELVEEQDCSGYNLCYFRRLLPGKIPLVKVH